MQMPTREEIVKFLVLARGKTWTRSGNRVTTLVPGLKIYDYDQEVFSYNDRVVGHARFTGIETIFFACLPVFGLSYSGGILRGHEDQANEVYAFLKRALLARAESVRLDQYTDYEEDGYRYRCDGTSLMKFEVVTSIRRRPHIEIYSVQYAFEFVEPRK